MAETVNQTDASQVDGAGLGAGRPGAAREPTGACATGPTAKLPGGRLARWLWPPRCLVCLDRGSSGLDLCGACTANLPWLGHACGRCALPMSEPGRDCGHCLRQPPPLTEAHAACLYGHPLDRLLPRFKFHHDLAAGRLLAQLMARSFAPLAADWAQAVALVPVPLHPRRLRQRGYDQALELARPLAHALQLPLGQRTLIRVRDTAAQSRLHADQRQRNLRDAFAVTASAALPAHVVLVDDVMTTGATLHAAADALRRAGVARVDAWVCARAP
ncbi:ComF family protein [Novilysobacter erysipheiresistens]|uniref:ComF family protein n=1 Tax=Novilysobacter erysipheiresistens TaxID=1749332 RepID=A0ABU7YYB9_9GAMM